MNKTKTNFIAFKKAIMETQNMMIKNAIYKDSDLKEATKKAFNIIFNNDNIKLLKNGNHKLNKNVFIFDLPEVITCRQACKNCYACKSSRIYKNTRVMRLYHLILINFAILNSEQHHEYIANILYYEIENICKKNKNLNVIRLHSSGDFFDRLYIDLWLYLIDRLLNNGVKNFIIYTYSKTLSNNEISTINNYFKNHLNIIKSLVKIDNKYFINYGNDNYINELSKKMTDKKISHAVCQYGKNEHEKCMFNCFKCLKHDHVLFYKH